jgi:hypothetical protein
MDINLVALLAISGIFGVWRLYDYRRSQFRQGLLRERVTWMLWLAATQTQTQ